MTICKTDGAHSILIDEMDRCIDLFCAACLTPWFTSGHHTCPLCRRGVPQGRMRPAIRERVRIGRLQSRCENAEHGCTWVGEFGLEGKHWDTHAAQCTHKQILCIYCNTQGRI
jgi:hypothetical protein